MKEIWYSSNNSNNDDEMCCHGKIGSFNIDKSI